MPAITRFPRELRNCLIYKNDYDIGTTDNSSTIRIFVFRIIRILISRASAIRFYRALAGLKQLYSVKVNF